jgi:prepilin-type N-terminal cleavage/methylation domain-containing protein
MLYEKGYSLVELLVTIGVMSILLGIGTLGFTTIRIQSQIDLVAAEVRSEILRVQSEAKNGIHSGVHFEPSRYVYFVGDTYVEGSPENEENTFFSNVSFTSITFTDNMVMFDPVTGYLTNFADPSQAVISGSGATHAVSVNQWGTVAIN